MQVIQHNYTRSDCNILLCFSIFTCQVTLLSYHFIILCSFLFSTDHKLDESHSPCCAVAQLTLSRYCIIQIRVTLKLLSDVTVVHLLIPCIGVITASDIKIVLSVPDSLSEILSILLIYETRKTDKCKVSLQHIVPYVCSKPKIFCVYVMVYEYISYLYSDRFPSNFLKSGHMDVCFQLNK